MIEIEAVERSYPDFRLGPIDLTVDGEVLAVLGPSGCGKTTLLSIVAGLVEPDAGSVSLDGRALDGLPPERRGTALLFQDGALFPHMTARENVAYAADDPAEGRIEELAVGLEIADVLDRRPAALSGGQRGRVALARALAAEPEALLLDEPLSSLDAPVARRLRGAMAETLADLGVPAVYVTHDQREAAAVGDRVAVMNEGELEQVGTPEAVFEQPATPFVAEFTGTRNRLPATVTGEGIRWGAVELAAPDSHGFAVGEDVWCCVRPEHFELRGSDRNGDEGGEPGTISGRVTARSYEGDGYALTVEPGDAREAIEAWLPSSRSGSTPAVGERVSVSLPPEAIHLLPR